MVLWHLPMAGRFGLSGKMGDGMCQMVKKKNYSNFEALDQESTPRAIQKVSFMVFRKELMGCY